MKKLFLALLLVSLSSCVTPAFAADFHTDINGSGDHGQVSADSIPEGAATFNTLESHIINLATSGEICKVYGHWWSYSDLVMTYTGATPVNPPKVRRCSLCGIKQVEKVTAPEWVTEP